MKSYEKESFFKIFLIFSSSLVLLSFIIAFMYYQQKKSYFDQTLLSQMREYSFNFKGKKFDATIVEKNPAYKLETLYKDKYNVYTLFLISKSSKNILKVFYPLAKYKKDLLKIKINILILFLLAVFVIVLLSLFYAYYALLPMRKALNLIEEFLKDVIHDINTPITTILLNSKYLATKNPSVELEWIELSAKKILSLYKNFEVDIKGINIKKIKVNITKLIRNRVEYFNRLYPRVDVKLTTLENYIWNVDKEGITRIIDNLLSNACKYSKDKDAKVEIELMANKIIIKDNGIGIKDTKRVFDRFYKENERGLGIGMHIVRKICNDLNIDISINSKKYFGTTIELTLR